MSDYLNKLTGEQMSHFFRSIAPMNVSFLGPYPDFFAFTMVLLLAVLLAVGVKESSMLNNVFTTVNMATIITIIVSGGINGSLKIFTLCLLLLFFSIFQYTIFQSSFCDTHF